MTIDIRTLPVGAGIHFVGVAGSGMNPLVRYLAALDRFSLSGSDRSLDNGENSLVREDLESRSIRIVPQDGRLPDQSVRLVIVSGAVETSIPDVRQARQLTIPVMSRAQLLASLAADSSSVAIAGTSGKTTVTAMCGHVLSKGGLHPSVICGGLMKSITPDGRDDNILVGDSGHFVFEADESDGSIVNYQPLVGLLLNISRDHKPIPELLELFSTFAARCRQTLVAPALDEHVATCLPHRSSECELITFGIECSATIVARDVRRHGWNTRFRIESQEFELRVPGRHNVLNSLAATGCGLALGLSLPVIAEALAGFQGTRRRLDVIGHTGDITVIDDFGHNPDKIAASLMTLRPLASRLLVYFQPHGFGPTAFLKDGLVETFASGLQSEDMLVFSPIYYAGGTVNRTIASDDLAAALRTKNTDARVIAQRDEAKNFLCHHARPGDIIVVMGARDDSLTTFAHSILDCLKERQKIS